MELNNIQKLAVELAVNNKSIFSITGSAGTGKSTVIGEIYKRVLSQKRTCSLLAPTGRAAKLLVNKFGSAFTIHKFLGYFSHDGGRTYMPSYGLNNKIPCDVVIVDEASMVNREVFENLLKALKDDCSLILVGDPNQLPPIEKVQQKSPFSYCIDRFDGIELSIKYRFGNQIEISRIADAVLKGSFKDVVSSKLSYALDGITDDIHINRLCQTDKYYGLDSQIISPTYKGKTGCDWINKLYQQHIWNDLYKFSNKISENFYSGDKVIFNMNTEYLNNGDILYIKEITDTALVFYDGDKNEIRCPRYISLFNRPYDLLKEVKLAYAITTHKSQGGEYENVVYIAGKASLPVINRANIYTGITRSRNNLVMLYDKYTLMKGLKNVSL